VKQTQTCSASVPASSALSVCESLCITLPADIKICLSNSWYGITTRAALMIPSLTRYRLSSAITAGLLTSTHNTTQHNTTPSASLYMTARSISANCRHWLLKTTSSNKSYNTSVKPFSTWNSTFLHRDSPSKSTSLSTSAFTLPAMLTSDIHQLSIGSLNASFLSSS